MGAMTNHKKADSGSEDSDANSDSQEMYMCRKCGHLLPGQSFYQSYIGARNYICTTCRRSEYHARTPEDRQKTQERRRQRKRYIKELAKAKKTGDKRRVLAVIHDMRTHRFHVPRICLSPDGADPSPRIDSKHSEKTVGCT